jgi:hypothetical protein
MITDCDMEMRTTELWRSLIAEDLNYGFALLRAENRREVFPRAAFRVAITRLSPPRTRRSHYSS